MRSSCFGPAIDKVVLIFLKGLICEAKERRRLEQKIGRYKIVSVMGDHIGYYIGGRFIPLGYDGGHYEC